jgi:hypothetical protein
MHNEGEKSSSISGQVGLRQVVFIECFTGGLSNASPLQQIGIFNSDVLFPYVTA